VTHKAAAAPAQAAVAPAAAAPAPAAVAKQEPPRPAAPVRAEPALRPKISAGANEVTVRPAAGASSAGSDADWETF